MHILETSEAKVPHTPNPRKKVQERLCIFGCYFKTRSVELCAYWESLASTMARKLQRASCSQTGTYSIRFETKIFTWAKALSYPNTTEIYHVEGRK